MIIGRRMKLLKSWKVTDRNTLKPCSTIIFTKKVDYTKDKATIDVKGVLGSDGLGEIDVSISEMSKYLALE